MSREVIRAVYKELLGKAKLMDKHASIKALLSPTEVSSNPHCQNAISHLFRQKMYYLPHASAVDTLRHVFRTKTNDIEAAFMAIRFLGEKINLAKQYGLVRKTPIPPTRTYDLLEPTKKPPSNVSVASTIEKGVYLIAHPLLYRPFEQSVILITNHGDRGTTGFIINERGEKKHTLWPNYRLDPDIQSLFGTHAVYYGGPVEGGFVQFLHSESTIGGSPIQVKNDPTTLYVGGNLVDFKNQNESKLQEVAFFNGYAGWTQNMLEKELEMGSWIMVHAPLSLALNPRNDLWCYLLEQLGREFNTFSSIPKYVNFHLNIN